MGKFAGFLKRIKNFTNKVVNMGAKGLKTVKGVWNDIITKPLTDTLYKIDNQINKGIDWIISKTNDKQKQKLTDNQPFNIPTRVNPLMLKHDF